MSHTLYKNNGLTRQAASEDLFEIHSQMVVAPSNISWLSIALIVVRQEGREVKLYGITFSAKNKIVTKPRIKPGHVS